MKQPSQQASTGLGAQGQSRHRWVFRLPLTPEQRQWACFSLLVTLGSRVLVWEASMIAARLFGLAQQPSPYNPSDLQPVGRSLGALLTFPVIRWDGDWYLAIAGHGYALTSGPSPPPRTNFFPLYPLLVGALHQVEVPLVLGAVLVSIASMTFGLYALGRLVSLELGLRSYLEGRDSARFTLLALALSPAAFFFSAAYGESLYLALSVGAFLYARRGVWVCAGLLAGLASATRGPGVLLTLPLLWLYFYGPREGRPVDRSARGWRPRYRLRPDVAWLALAPLGLIAYMAYLGLSGVDPFAFVQTQHRLWQHQLAFPWITVWHAITAAYGDVRRILDGQAQLTLFGTYPGASVNPGWQNLLPLLSLVLAIPAAVGVWRRLPAAYGIYVTVSILLILISPVRFEPLQGLPRYLTVLFPLFIWAGLMLARHRRWRAPVLVSSAAALALLSAEFATWHFVA